MAYLFIADFFGGTEQAVARDVDDHVDAAEVRKRLVDDPMHRCRIGHIEFGDPQALAMLGLQIIQRMGFTQSGRHTIAAGEQLFGHRATEAR